MTLSTFGACGDDGGAEPEPEPDSGARLTCIDPLPLDCEPSYPPTYEQIYERVIARSCGNVETGINCHGPEGGQFGLVLADPEGALAALRGELDGRPRVVPGEPECSTLVQRIESDDPSFRMPVGSDPLPAGARCAIRQWIANGAEP